MSAPKCLFIFYNSFSLQLTENLHKPKKKFINMFCSYYFYVKCIIKKNYLSSYSPLNTQGYNGSEYVCISWSDALEQLLLLRVEQSARRVLFLGEREISIQQD